MTLCGIQWNKSTGVYTRLEALAGKTKAEAIAFCNGVDPWMSMKRVNLWTNGTVTNICDIDFCYSDYDVANVGQAMVKLKKFWYYHYRNGNDYYWYIADNADELVGENPVKLHPAFSRDGVTKDQIYFSAYEGYINPITQLLESCATAHAPTTSKTIGDFRIAAETRGTGWEIMDYLSLAAVQLALFVEYGNFNLQNVDDGIGPGVTGIVDDTEHNMASFCGHTTTLKNASGQVEHVRDHQTPPSAAHDFAMSYRGIENLYGNTSTFIDGVNIGHGTSYLVCIADHRPFVDSSCSHPYVSTTENLPAASGYISDFAYDAAAFDYGFLPSAVGGAHTCSDYFFTNVGGDRILFCSGHWDAAYQNYFGPFYVNSYNAAAYTFRGVGARLVYIG